VVGARIFKVKLIGDSKDAEMAFKRLGMTAKEQSGAITKTMSSLNNALRLGGAIIAFRGVSNAVSSLTNAAYESQKVTAQTAAIINSTGGAAGVTAKYVADLSRTLSEQVGIDDELIQKSMNLLLTFKKVQNQAGEGNDIFRQASVLALDLGNVFGSTDSAAVQLGKALSDPIRGITALRRAGVDFTDAQKEQIKTYVESNNLLEAQKLILAEVESQVGGTAAATATGADKFRVAWGNVQEDLGNLLLPVLEKVMNFIKTDVLPIFTNFTQVVSEKGLGGGIQYLTGAIWNLLGGMGALGKILQVVTIGFIGLKTVTITYTAITKALELVTKVGTASMQAYASSVNAARLATVAAGSIGIIVTALATAYAFLSSKKAEQVDVTNELTSALKTEGDAQKKALEQLYVSNDVFRNAFIGISRYAGGLDDMNYWLQTGQGSFGTLMDAVAGFSGTMGQNDTEILNYLDSIIALTGWSYEQAGGFLEVSVELQKLRGEYILAAQAAGLFAGRAIMTEQEFNNFMGPQPYKTYSEYLNAVTSDLTQTDNAMKSIGGSARQTESASERFLKAMYEGAKRTAQEFIDFRNSIQDSVSSMLDLGDAYEKSGNNLKNFLNEVRKQAREIKQFSSNLGRLQEQGLSIPAIQQILGMGAIEGGALAQALLEGGQSAISTINRALGQVSQVGMGLGQQLATAAVYNNNSTMYNTITIVSNDPNAIVRALQQYQRQNGSIPIRVTG
jgi:hypothetical protein